MIFVYILLLAVSFFALVKGADIFVDGSSSLAKNFNVSELMIGLTIVALGTSLPELAVSTMASMEGANEIALSNVVGSNTFNLLCVLGVCALFCPVPVERTALVRDFPISIIITFLLLPITGALNAYKGDITRCDMNAQAGTIGRTEGLVLVVLFAAYILFLIFETKSNPREGSEKPQEAVRKCIFHIVLGLVLIIAGGQGAVYGARKIAAAWGMSETLIGLTVVAVGTSLPELVTSIVAAKKGEVSLAVGNVIGSNIFNILFILGLASALDPVGVNYASAYDIGILALVTLLVYVFLLIRRKLGRLHGITMLGIYIATVVFATDR